MQPIVTDQVVWSDGLSVCYSSEPCKNGSTDRDAWPVWFQLIPMWVTENSKQDICIVL